jgi:hypothetical protein
MEASSLALIVIAAIAGMVAFDLVAVHFGVDSRDTLGDDHSRSVRL